MIFKVKCKVCECELWIPGDYEPDTNATNLSDTSYRWDDACEHIKNTGDYDIVDQDDVDDEC